MRDKSLHVIIVDMNACQSYTNFDRHCVKETAPANGRQLVTETSPAISRHRNF